MESPRGHQPVMLEEAMALLAPRDGGIYVDGSFGGGGYSDALLRRARCVVYALDCDPLAVARGRRLEAYWSGRLTLIEGRFGDMRRLLTERGAPQVDGVVLDVGVSSMQLDDAARGFSFMADGPLDMRMEGAVSKRRSAAEVVNGESASSLTAILRRFGEERRAARIASFIVRERRRRQLSGSLQLAALVEKAVGGRRGRLHPATRTFLALRMYVNDELGELAKALEAATALLRPGGRLVTVTFHSLEDRIVKDFLTAGGGRRSNPSRHAPDGWRPAYNPPPLWKIVQRRALRPGPAERDANPRSRSARLRAAERLEQRQCA